MTAAPLTVAVTGASGFIGRALVARLAADERFAVRGCYRQAPAAWAAGAEVCITGDLLEADGWRAAFSGAAAVVHTAGHAHAMMANPDALAAYRRVNVEGAVAVARAAVAAGVRRFVFLSSIGVHGESTAAGHAFREDDVPAPRSPYAVSKRDAEVALAGLAHDTGLELVVLRPPLVHGPGAPGNLRRLLALVRRGLPLPLGSIRNRRSLIGIDNLCSAIAACLTHPAAAGRTFVVSDQDDLSTPQIIAAMADGLGVRARLVPCPVTLLAAAGHLTGRGGEIHRLVSSLCVDSGAISRELGWDPAVPAMVGLAEMARRSGGG